MDGFVVSICSPFKPNIENHKRVIETISSYFRLIQSENFFENNLISTSKEEIDLTTEIGFLCNMLRKNSENLKNSLIIYYGDIHEDLENISKIRIKSSILVVSSKRFFLNFAKLYFGFEVHRIKNFDNQLQLEKYLLEKFGFNNTIILFFSSEGKKGVKILSQAP